MKRCLLLPLLAIAVCAPLKAAVNLQEALTPEEFARAGLHQLSEEQLEHLNTMVGRFVEGASVSHRSGREEQNAVSQPPSGDDAFGLEAVTERVAALFKDRTEDTLVSRVSGPFKGWRGKTIFELENGQVWRQVVPGDFVVNLDSPTVTIRRAAFGSYLLSVEGYNSSVRVRRVK